ncbi:MAG: hypothetical protein KTR21_07400, partial [Rhodobacteraceae bacterium]|nr:hypothetical protein [Paracoccaceae bacterium]
STLLYLDVTQTSPLSAYGARLGYRARRWQFDPYLHFHGYLTPGRDMLNLSNYQLQPALTYFRAKLRCPAPCQYPAVENIPFKLIAGDTASARTDMAALRAVIGRPIDHIVIHWGETPPAADLQQRMMTALGADYRTNAFAAESRFEWLTRTAP